MGEPRFKKRPWVGAGLLILGLALVLVLLGRGGAGAQRPRGIETRAPRAKAEPPRALLRPLGAHVAPPAASSNEVSLLGLVLDDDEQPLAGVRITAMRIINAGISHAPDVVSASDGRFRLALPGPGLYGFELNPSAPYVRVLVPDEPLQIDGKRELVLHVPRGYPLDGVVLQHDRSPVRGASVVAEGHGSVSVDGAETDGSGRFHLAHVPLGRVRLAATAVDGKGMQEETRRSSPRAARSGWKPRGRTRSSRAWRRGNTGSSSRLGRTEASPAQSRS